MEMGMYYSLFIFRNSRKTIYDIESYMINDHQIQHPNINHTTVSESSNGMYPNMNDIMVSEFLNGMYPIAVSESSNGMANVYFYY
jgi:hypothetical protein